MSIPLASQNQASFFKSIKDLRTVDLEFTSSEGTSDDLSGLNLRDRDSESGITIWRRKRVKGPTRQEDRDLAGYHPSISGDVGFRSGPPNETRVQVPSPAPNPQHAPLDCRPVG